MGSFSFREKLFAYPNTELCLVPPGPVAALFQSGGNIQFWMKSASDRGLRFSYAVSSGNEADLDLADYLNFVVDDPHTRQIVLFIEGIRRPQAFMHAAGRALQAGKPVLAIKTGATQKSRAAAQSHTGAIGGDYAAYCRCASVTESSTAAHSRICSKRRSCSRMAGCRRARASGSSPIPAVQSTCFMIIRNSRTVAVPAFDAATNEALMPHMQEGILPKNPLDTGIPSTLKVAVDQCAVVASDPNIDIVAWCTPMPGRNPNWSDSHEVVAAAPSLTSRSSHSRE